MLFESKLRNRAFLLFIVLLSAASLEAQPEPDYLVRIVEFTMSNYTCTTVTQDHQLRQVRTTINDGIPSSPELRVGPATVDDIKKIDELLRQPEFRKTASNAIRQPHMVERDGKGIAVLAEIDGTLKEAEFTDTAGTKSMPSFLKDFDSFVAAVRHRKMKKVKESVPGMCSLKLR